MAVAWRRARGSAQVSLRVTVPDNVTATVSLPAGARPYRAVGAGAPREEGARGRRMVYAVGSGTSAFAPAGGRWANPGAGPDHAARTAPAA